jgi:hypothetical protein
MPNNSPERLDGSSEEARRFVQSYLDKAEKAAREAIRLDSRNLSPIPHWRVLGRFAAS